jgi:putative phosphoesterase
MTAPSNSKKCQIDESYCKFGSETILKLLEGFNENIDGVIKNKDIECVHKTRVTTRRLRATMPLFKFCFPPKHFKKWIEEIKNVTRLLGASRDLDVQIVFIEQYMKNLNAEEKKFINNLLKDHKAQRKNIQPSVVNGLEALKGSNTLENINRFCEENVTEQLHLSFGPDQVLEKAYWHISFRLDDFLSMRKYVYSENEKEKLHEMRIFAKRLRYTMEAFSALYRNNLKEEIENIKAYQDDLGELHDCDVWLEYVPKFSAKILNKKANGKKNDFEEFEIAFKNFSTYVAAKRKEYYLQFIDHWEDNKENGFFEKLRKTTKVGIIMNEEKIKQLLAKTNVKVGVFSDVHANLHALQRVFQDGEERGIQVFLNAGDSIGFGPCPNEVLELLCEKNVLNILGNYDIEVLEGKKTDAKAEKKIAFKFITKELATSCKDYLASLPHELRLEVAGKKLLVTHGSPESIEEHIFPDTPAERLKTLAATAKVDVIVVGHSHEQFRKDTSGTCFVNPGSVGRPGDGNPQAAYAILSFNPFKIDLIRLDYDIEGAAGSLRKKGLPESFSQMLLRGVSLDAVIEEDKTKEDWMIQDCKGAVQVSGEVSKNYWPEMEHCSQVSKLAMQLFDGLIVLHQLGMRERCWLECAAILHDIGLAKSRGGHHKKSAKLILNETKLPFTSQERRIIASIARYHRKASPKPSHYNLSSLDRETVHKVTLLSSLLRIADSLDYTHQSKAEAINIKVGTKKVTVECISETKPVLEEQAFNKKKDLFEKVFSKKMVLTWKQPSKPLVM